MCSVNAGTSIKAEVLAAFRSQAFKCVSTVPRRKNVNYVPLAYLLTLLSNVIFMGNELKKQQWLPINLGRVLIPFPKSPKSIIKKYYPQLLMIQDSGQSSQGSEFLVKATLDCFKPDWPVRRCSLSGRLCCPPHCKRWQASGPEGRALDPEGDYLSKRQTDRYKHCVICFQMKSTKM